MFDGLSPASPLREGEGSVAQRGDLTPWYSGLGKDHALYDLLTNPHYGEIFNRAERQTRLVDNAFAEQRSIEEAYDRQIATVRDATGVTLENPLRGGYRQEVARRAKRIQHGLEEGDGLSAPDYAAKIYADRLAELRTAHPELDPGDIKTMAQGIAKGAAEDAAKPWEDVNPIAAGAASFAGGLWGMRRDPIFVGSLFAGPTSAVGKTALARIASSSLFQGLYNAGTAAVEQPAVQAWRQELGLRHGVEPALETVGLAFLFGAIPGAAIRGGQEFMAGRQSLERVLRGTAEPGDLEKGMAAARAALGEIDADRRAALRMGDDMLTADKATIPDPAKGVPEDLHNDMTAAALTHADDPEAPSPAAVAAVDRVGREPNAADADLQARIAEANPQSVREAQVAADHALDDIGRATGMDVLRRQQDEQAQARTALAQSRVDAEQPSRGDPLGKVPFARDDGSTVLLSPAAAAKQGEREANLAMLIRSCK